MENKENLLFELFLNMMDWIYFLLEYKNLGLVEPNYPSVSFCGHHGASDALEFICNYNLEIFDMPITEEGRNCLIHCLSCHPCIDEFRRVYEDLLYSLDNHDPPESDFFDDLAPL